MAQENQPVIVQTEMTDESNSSSEKSEAEDKNELSTTTIVSTVTSTFSYWNPLTWLGKSYVESTSPIEQIESKMFSSIKSSSDMSRFYVNLRNDSLKIWTVAVNAKSTQIPVVLGNFLPPVQKLYYI